MIYTQAQAQAGVGKGSMVEDRGWWNGGQGAELQTPGSPWSVASAPPALQMVSF